MQCLFDIAFHAQPISAAHPPPAAADGDTGARSGQPSVRLASLKLLGVTLTSLATGDCGDDDEQGARCVMLEMPCELATRDASGDVHSLGSAAQTAFGGEGIAW